MNATDPSSQIDAAPSDALSVWLALPQSINFFDGGGLSPVERERLATRRKRRRHEFAVSRALMAQPWQLFVFEPEPDLSVAVVYVGTDAQLRISCFEWPPLRNVMWPIAAQARGFDPAAAGTAGNAFQPLSR